MCMLFVGRVLGAGATLTARMYYIMYKWIRYKYSDCVTCTGGTLVGARCGVYR